MREIDRIYQTVAAGVAAIVIAAGVACVVYQPADTFDIQLSAPSTIEVGEIALLDAGETGADSYAYSVTPPVTCLIFEGGTKLAFASGTPGEEYTFVVAAAKGGQVSIVEHTVTVTGDGPGPNVPAGFKAKLQRAVRLVESPRKAEELAGLSESFRTVASMIAAGVIDSPEDAQTATVNLNSEVLGDNREAWAAVRDVISVELQARAAAGTLTDMPSHAAAWREVAAILKESA